MRAARVAAAIAAAALLLANSLRERVPAPRTAPWPAPVVTGPPAPVPSTPEGRHVDGEQCDQGPPSSMAACAFADARVAPADAAANCTAGTVLRRWHVTTQELLFAHLRLVWADDRPRVFVDLGSQAGHGLYRNTSDALLWLGYFNASGSMVAAARSNGPLWWSCCGVRVCTAVSTAAPQALSTG